MTHLRAFANLVAWTAALLIAGAAITRCAPNNLPEPMPPLWAPDGRTCGIWATDHRQPAGGLLPERHQDDRPGDGIGVAVHHITDVRTDRYGRPTAYRIRSYSRASGDSCDTWVSPTAFPAWAYVHPYRDWHARARGFIPTTNLVRWEAGDSIPVTCIYEPGTDDLLIQRWAGVPAESFRPCAD